MTDLITAAQQALDDLKDLHTNHNITYAGTIWRLEAALAQEPHRDLRAALQTPGCERLREWVEIGPAQRAALETCVAALALAQEQAEPPGCDRCNHPLYAATKCRVCGRVTEPKGGGNLPPPLQEPAVAENATTQQQLADTPPSDYRRSYLDGYFDGFAIGKREGRIEAEDKLAQEAEPVEAAAQYSDIVSDGGMDPRNKYDTAPPQRQPLSDEEIIDATEHIDTSRDGYFIDIARAVERAHGIGGQE